MIALVKLWKAKNSDNTTLRPLEKQLYQRKFPVLLRGTYLQETAEESLLEDMNVAENDLIVIETMYQGKFRLEENTEPEDEEEEKKLVLQEGDDDIPLDMKELKVFFINYDLAKLATVKSRMGQTGLQNLGNTCFMNSGLQCLSNTTELAKYFLYGLWKKELNKKNKLGLGGKLAEAYNSLVTDLW